MGTHERLRASSRRWRTRRPLKNKTPPQLNNEMFEARALVTELMVGRVLRLQRWPFQYLYNVRFARFAPPCVAFYDVNIKRYHNGFNLYSRGCGSEESLGGDAGLQVSTNVGTDALKNSERRRSIFMLERYHVLVLFADSKLRCRGVSFACFSRIIASSNIFKQIIHIYLPIYYS